MTDKNIFDTLNFLNDITHALSIQLQKNETCPVTIGNDENGKCYYISKDTNNNITVTAEEYWYTDENNDVHYSYLSWSNNKAEISITEQKNSLQACREARRVRIKEEIEKHKKKG